MSDPRPIVLVDTNIWLDNYLASRPSAQTSRQFLDEAYRQDYQLAYAAHCIKDVFFLIQSGLKRMKRESGALTEGDALAIQTIAWECINNMRDLACAVTADESDVWIACRHRALTQDLEDNLTIAAAQRAKAKFLVTNDERLLKHSPVPTLSAADALVLLTENVK